MSSATAATCAAILNFPIRDAEIKSPSAAAIERRPETANSRPTMMQTAHAGASRFSTSEMSAALMSSLSAMASRDLPVEIVCEGRAEEERDAEEVALHAEPVLGKRREQDDDEHGDEEDARQRQCVRKIKHASSLLSSPDVRLAVILL